MLKRGVMPFLLSTWLMKRTTFDELNGFDPEFKTSQDFEFLYRHLLSGGNIEVIREQLLTYLIHSTSETTTKHFEQKLTLSYVLDREAGSYRNLHEYLEKNSKNWHQMTKSKSDILIRKFIMSNNFYKILNLHLLLAAFLFSPVRFVIKIWLQRPAKILTNFLSKLVTK
jgi:uncharacterized Fe-S radical SAM superfamily protein PflX